MSMGDFVTLKADNSMESGDRTVNMIYVPTGAAMATITFTR